MARSFESLDGILDHRFEVEREVAAGGMGRIYSARDRQTGRAVAIKIMQPEDRIATERFAREAALLAEVRHPGVVEYIAHGTLPGGGPYLVMEWLEGVDLGERLTAAARDSRVSAASGATVDRAATLRIRPGDGAPSVAADSGPASGPASAAGTAPASAANGRASGQATAAGTAPASAANGPASGQATAAGTAPASAANGQAIAASGPVVVPVVGLPLAQVVALGRRLASALGEVHKLGIVHRDLKPSNVFLVDGDLGRAKLIDFGTARETMGARPLTESGVLVGTPYYMAPEQVRGGALGPAVDVWALGCVLYECLAGRSPFAAAHPLSAMAQIVIDDPPWIDAARPDCPPLLAHVIHACLAKDPALRPATGDVVGELLKQIDVSALADDSAPARTGPRVVAPRLTTGETRVASLLFARVASDDAAAAVRAVVGAHGGAVETLAAHGTLLVTSTGTSAGVHSPKDQAARAALLAIALREVAPGATLVVATGRGGERTGAVGELFDGAVASLMRGGPGQIFVDKLTAGLLEGRFELRGDPGHHELVREHVDEAARTLLGKPSRWVGRRREATTLTATFDECAEDRIARAVLVTAPAGIGKSRLRYEFLRSLAGREVEILHGHGDAFSAGSPFVMIAPALRRSAGILDGEDAELRHAKLRARIARSVAPPRLARVVALLGELVGVAAPAGGAAETGDPETAEALRAARSDPMLMGELMRGAWEEWLRAECAQHPVLLVLEDLHWGDLPSVSYVDAALRALVDQPLMVLALARPEIHATFPHLWASRDVQELKLAALATKACGEIIADALGDRARPALVDQIIARSEGNAFYLEELIRAVAEDAGGAAAALPDSVIGMVQARLGAFDLDARRLLRAGAVFGEVFWEGGVRALLGDDAGAFDAREWLADLERREVVAPRKDARLPGEREYKFRHALVRDAAYEMLTAEDRVLGHRLAGAWLERAGETDALALAAHFERGGDGARAVHWLVRAAEEALEGNDLAAVIERGERAVAAGATGDALGAIRALQSTAAYWRSAYAEGRRFGEAAMTLIPAGEVDWFKATGGALVACARLGDFTGFDALFERALAAVAAPHAHAAQLICLCRGTFQLIFNGRFARADEVLGHIAGLTATAEALGGAASIDALTRAQVEHVQGVRAAHVGDVRRFLRHLEAAGDAFDRAGDTRNVSLERTTVAWCWAEIGDLALAESLCRKNLEHCRQLRAPQAVTYARVNLGFILGLRAATLDEAQAESRAAIAECRAVGNQRLEGWATAHLAAALRDTGDHAGSLEHASAAAGLLASAPGLCAWAQSLEALALVALGRAGEALPLARSAVTVLERIGGLLQGESLPPLALALALDAAGDRAGAAAAIADACARIDARAARLDDPAWQAMFRALPDNAFTVAWARGLG